MRIQLNAAEWPIQRNVCPLERCLETTYSASKVGQHRGHVAPHDKLPAADDVVDVARAVRGRAPLPRHVHTERVAHPPDAVQEEARRRRQRPQPLGDRLGGEAEHGAELLGRDLAVGVRVHPPQDLLRRLWPHGRARLGEARPQLRQRDETVAGRVELAEETLDGAVVEQRRAALVQWCQCGAWRLEDRARLQYRLAIRIAAIKGDDAAAWQRGKAAGLAKPSIGERPSRRPPPTAGGCEGHRASRQQRQHGPAGEIMKS
mmetsp:Transcript_10516/g.33345  ORF Transcript_10516/g.33345 Transcript_10516/m.33345 type:complete len:260 (+) Transcript_10516:859-1638(+)